MKRTFRIILYILLFIFPSLQAKVILPSILGDNMVLQQQSQVYFHGKATARKNVSLTVSWGKKKVIVKSNNAGEWKAIIHTPSAGGPYAIFISDGETLTLKNILIGEVWFCSGQSNMEMPVKGFSGQPVYGSHPYIVAADFHRSLRLFTVKNDWSTTPKEDVEGHWAESSPKEVSTFSAAAYFFGEQLQKTLGIPVGLVHCSWSASKIEAWMDKETLSRFPEVDLSVLKNKEFGYPNGTPTLLHNAMVKPLEGFSVKGVIWYQGEANSDNPVLYKKLFPALVSQWRTFFNSPNLPFYYVQIAPWQSGGNDQLDWAWFRQCQLELMKEVPNVGMVTTTDVGSEKFIHPPYKIKVGQRLAYWALAKTYGIEGIAYSGPIYNNCILKDKVVEVQFDYGEDGLIPENEELKGFEIAGQDGIFLPAHAEIINGSSIVKVWNNKISSPKEVRYCFRNYIEGNLFNNAELPASPFRAVIKQ
ncbi:sialate O-acetylesterase [uncultured Bacteroides sp.]|uniref:sialate O-acetylesterase n=1 Tax=uncultured Bacteroides sp. TaxID=162156 RepID=UPI002AAB49F4|nr:sialate O-acetylesterase [uncultured Bacteroides sp.]